MNNARYRNRSVGSGIKIWTGNTGRVQVSDNGSINEDIDGVNLPCIEGYGILSITRP
jgi:hypothetical protein